MRKLYPDVTFDWKKIAQQLAEKREACRRYRSHRRGRNTARPARGSEAFYGVYEPGSRTVYTNCVPSTAGGVGALLDAILQIGHGLLEAPSLLELPNKMPKPRLMLVKNSGHSER